MRRETSGSSREREKIPCVAIYMQGRTRKKEWSMKRVATRREDILCSERHPGIKESEKKHLRGDMNARRNRKNEWSRERVYNV